MSRNILLLSNGTVYGRQFLNHAEDEIKEFIGNRKNVLFIPYANPSGMGYDAYTQLVTTRFEMMGYTITYMKNHN